MFTRPDLATVPLTGAIADRYMTEGGIRSASGWPLRRNVTTAKGERARFEKGYIVWIKRTGKTRVVIP